MTQQEYRDAYRGNQRIVRKFITTRSMNLLGSAGVPEKGARLMGAAASLAASAATNHDVKLNINDKRTMFLEIRDASEDDRSLFLRFRKRW